MSVPPASMTAAAFRAMQGLSAAPAAAGLVARGTLAPREMNGTEAAYDAYLSGLRAAGEILWHAFEAIKLRLADDTFYTPDFAVLKADLAFEFRETKGFWRDDARVKIKVAAELFPFRFIAVRKRTKREGGGWAEEVFA